MDWQAASRNYMKKQGMIETNVNCSSAELKQHKVHLGNTNIRQGNSASKEIALQVSLTKILFRITQ